MTASDSLCLLGDHLRSLTPTGIVVEVGSDALSCELLSAEASATAGWAANRRAQFANGRACARRALERLGIQSQAILFDDEGAPRWPRGAVGSISHKKQYCIVAVAASSSFTSLGVDLERDVTEPEENEIVRRVCRTASELAQASGLGTQMRSPGTLFLSAKEAFFKFQFPKTRARLDWEDVEVIFTGTTFTARAFDRPEADVCRGIFVSAGDWLATFAS